MLNIQLSKKSAPALIYMNFLCKHWLFLTCLLPYSIYAFPYSRKGRCYPHNNGVATRITQPPPPRSTNARFIRRANDRLSWREWYFITRRPLTSKYLLKAWSYYQSLYKQQQSGGCPLENIQRLLGEWRVVNIFTSHVWQMVLANGGLGGRGWGAHQRAKPNQKCASRFS